MSTCRKGSARQHLFPEDNGQGMRNGPSKNRERKLAYLRESKRETHSVEMRMALARIENGSESWTCFFNKVASVLIVIKLTALFPAVRLLLSYSASTLSKQQWASWILPTDIYKEPNWLVAFNRKGWWRGIWCASKSTRVDSYTTIASSNRP